MSFKHWTDAKPHTWDGRSDGRQLSDAQVADKVRMLMRSDWDHEFVCTLTRDRIARLSREHDRMRALVERIAAGGAKQIEQQARDVLSAIERDRSLNAHLPQEEKEEALETRMTVAQGMELNSIQFEEGCGRVVCVDVWGENCHCMDSLCKVFPELREKRAALLKATPQINEERR